MKIILIYFSIFILFISCDKIDFNEGWTLVWEDNFDGNRFNESYWSKIPRGKVEWNKYMSDYDSCYLVKDGSLILKGIVNYNRSKDTVPYLTGGLYTKGKVNFNYGRIEVKAKLYEATGAWPAIWMLPETGKWPYGGEIDIMERPNYEDKVYQTIHTYYTYNLGIVDNPKRGETGKIKLNKFNIYGVDISPDKLDFYINRKLTFSYPRIETTKEGQYPFGKPFYLLIDMQLGGTWTGEVNEADLPVKIEIDWVRYYQKKELNID